MPSLAGTHQRRRLGDVLEKEEGEEESGIQTVGWDHEQHLVCFEVSGAEVVGGTTAVRI